MEFSADRPDVTLTQTYARLQSLLLATATVEQYLQDLADLAAGVLDPPASCGITTSYDGRPMTVVSSDARATLLDETQYDLDDGTCLQAMRTGTIVYVSDLDTERRWSGYVAQARETGLRSSLSLPLTVQGTTFGAMNLYAFHTKDAFDASERHRGMLLAAQASGALQLATQNVRSGEILQQLERTLASRSVIDQALGILMSERQWGSSEAFAHLRVISQRTQRKLRDVAADVLAQTATGQSAAETSTTS